MFSTLGVLAVLELLGLAALPLTARALARLPAGGLAFAKPLGLLLVTWVAWMLASLGFPNGTWSALGAALVVAMAGALVWRFGAPPAADAQRRRHLIAGEIVFLGTFLVAALFIAFTPAVWETEKPMDMAFVNATIQSDSYPPHDPWMSGEKLNYYYFGHVAAGMLIRLTGVEPTVGSNLALAAIFALALTTAFALAAAIAEGARRRGMAVRRPLVAGAGAAVALGVMGSLRGGGKALGWDGPLRTFDWFGQSRVIPDTINEFPYFSLLVQDLHAHVIALPFTLLALAFTVQVALNGPPRALGLRGLLETFGAALSIGVLYAINSWSWPVAVGLLVLAAAAWAREPESAGRRAGAAAWCALVIALGILLVLPFIVAFDPNAKGFGIVDRREPFGLFMRHNLVIYGGLAWLVGALYASRVTRAAHPWRLLVWGAGGAAVVLPLLASEDLAGPAVIVVLAVVALHATFAAGLSAPERVLWLLVAAAFACIAGPELLYVRDEFDGGPFYRMNTVFKLGYQAWILLAIPAGCALAMAPIWLDRVPRVVWRAGAVAVLAVGLVYTGIAAYARKDAFAASPTLDGRAWLALLAPGDVAAIDWIRDNVPRDAVILEAVGDDYSAFGHARISTYTGRPTVLGWPGHELQWSHAPGTRREDVQAIYAAGDARVARDLLTRYRVSYAVLGPIERTDYGSAPVLQGIGTKVFDQEGTVVYRLPQWGARRPKPTPTPTPGDPILGG